MNQGMRRYRFRVIIVNERETNTEISTLKKITLQKSFPKLIVERDEMIVGSDIEAD